MSGTNLVKIPVLIIALVTGIIMTTTAIVPLVSDYAEAKTFSNVDGSYSYMEHLSGDGDDYTLVWDPINSPTKATVNGETVSMFSGTVVCSVGDMLVRWGTSTSSGYYLQSVPNTFLPSVGTNTATGNVTITAIDGVLTMTYGETTNTMNYTDGYFISTEGDYVMKTSSQSVYLNGDSEIVAMGLTNMGGVWNNALYVSGNIDDGFVCTQFYPDPATYTFSNYANDSQSISGFEDLYSLTKITFTATQIADESVTYDVTYSYFIVPSEVSAEPDNPAAYKALVKVVPVMAFVALIAAAAYMIYSKRD